MKMRGTEKQEGISSDGKLKARLSESEMFEGCLRNRLWVCESRMIRNALGQDSPLREWGTLLSGHRKQRVRATMAGSAASSKSHTCISSWNQDAFSLLYLNSGNVRTT